LYPELQKKNASCNLTCNLKAYAATPLETRNVSVTTPITTTTIEIFHFRITKIKYIKVELQLPL
jgi:hypothetical protein